MRMRGSRRRAVAVPLLLGLFVLAEPLAAAAGTSPPVSASPLAVTPDVVHADLLFSGALLHVRGTIPEGHQAAVICTGADGRLNLRRKGRVWGLFWMNTGEIAFDGVPSLYLLCTSAPVAQLAPAGVLARLGTGLDALESRAAFEGPAADRKTLFGQMIRLKREEGLYAVAEGATRLKPGAQGMLDVAADLFLPARTPQGEYRIRLVSFQGGDGFVRSETSVVLRQTGFAAFTSRMAHERGLLYGIVSVVLAIAAGMLTGFVFGRGSRRPH
jgi:uncharacterized protein (TIGR02186 family)